MRESKEILRAKIEVDRRVQLKMLKLNIGYIDAFHLVAAEPKNLKLMETFFDRRDGLIDSTQPNT